MSENQGFLTLIDLHVNFHLRAGVLPAVQGVNLSMQKGETLGVVGESGGGKSVMAPGTNGTPLLISTERWGYILYPPVGQTC